MGLWYNQDKLLIKLGKDEATSQNASAPAAKAGSYKTYGDLSVIELRIDLTKLNAFGNVTILNDTIFYPKGAVAEEVEIEVAEAATGTNATLSIGTVQNADRTTAISATAFTTAGLLQTALTPVGTKLRLTAGSTGAGAYIGVANTLPALITATAGTANFTAGVIYVRIKFRSALAS